MVLLETLQSPAAPLGELIHIALAAVRTQAATLLRPTGGVVGHEAWGEGQDSLSFIADRVDPPIHFSF